MQTSVVSKEPQAKDQPLAANRPAPVKSHSWQWLGVAALLLLFSYAADNIPLAAWLAPVFLLRFVRGRRAAVGLPIAYAVLVATSVFQYRGMVPIPGAGLYIFFVLWGIPLLVPYAVDRFVAHKLAGLSASLVFATAWATTEYLGSFGPYGSWGAVAYSQYGNLPLMQIVSVTGLWGITFLIGWFAAVCNWVWEEGLASRPARMGAWQCAGTIAAVMLWGGARMALFPPSSQTVRVASLTRMKVQPEPSDTVWRRFRQNQATSAEIEEIRAGTNAVSSNLLARAEREAQAGAKIVFWAEGNAPVLKEDEPELIERGRALAARYKIYLGMALGTWSRVQNHPWENKLVLIEPNGEVAWQYNKVRPVPGGEAAMQLRGDGRLREVDTPYGRLSSVICFDADFPQLLAQAGALRADVVMDPSGDWRAIDPWHTQMASFRALEQGFNLVRQTSHGLSAAFDYQGRQLAAMDHYQTIDYVMTSEIPIKGVRTLYSRFGDWFAWVCAMGLLVLLAKGLTGSRRALP